MKNILKALCRFISAGAINKTCADMKNELFKRYHIVDDGLLGSGIVGKYSCFELTYYLLLQVTDTALICKQLLVFRRKIPHPSSGV